MNIVLEIICYLLIGLITCFFILLVGPFNKINNFLLYRIKSKSMYPVFKWQDYVIVRKSSSYDYGDLVKCTSVREYEDKKYTNHFTGRIVGVSGDKITRKDCMIHIEGKSVVYKKIRELQFFNGGNLYEEFEEILPNGKKNFIYRFLSSFPEDDYEEEDDTVVIPLGHFYVLCDMRDFAEDSSAYGSIPIEDIQGKIVKRLRSKELAGGPWKFYKYALWGYKKEN